MEPIRSPPAFVVVVVFPVHHFLQFLLRESLLHSSVQWPYYPELLLALSLQSVELPLFLVQGLHQVHDLVEKLHRLLWIAWGEWWGETVPTANVRFRQIEEIVRVAFTEGNVFFLWWCYVIVFALIVIGIDSLVWGYRVLSKDFDVLLLLIGSKFTRFLGRKAKGSSLLLIFGWFFGWSSLWKSNFREEIIVFLPLDL